MVTLESVSQQCQIKYTAEKEHLDQPAACGITYGDKLGKGKILTLLICEYPGPLNPWHYAWDFNFSRVALKGKQ